MQQVRPALRLGLLREGDRLPTVKEVVAQLAINPNTVLKACRELEPQGLVAPRPGIGTFVTRTLTDSTLAALGPLRRDLRDDRRLRARRAAHQRARGNLHARGVPRKGWPPAAPVAHGYAVVGIDQTYESLATAFPDGRSPRASPARPARARSSARN
ncbi:hypothetical protein GCM10023191_011320 [Actinoallomurus oryzae]|uniref:HTH gntR-type domain-containing protein n=1 Tax=Actinoallomurus oryzae TaxID=502180 RepID=A0ABP8PG28_9ACTN